MVGNEATWSQQVFGACDLGDSRRTRRLVDVGARLARQVGASMAQCYEGEGASFAGQLSTDPQRGRLAGSDPGRWLETDRTAATSCPDVLLAI